MSSSKTGEATPRPWVLHHPSGIRICDGAHESLGGCLSIAEAEILGRDRSESVSNAAFIVEAVNSYEALQEQNRKLREACEAALKWIDWATDISNPEPDNSKVVIAQLRAALKDGQL